MTDAGDIPSPGTSDSNSSGSDEPGPPRGNPVYSADASAVIEAIERPLEHPDDEAIHKGRLPPLDLPSFGEPDDDCGNVTPATMWICPNCCTRHDLPHVCNRYDCPLHWAHAVRRRAAGSRSGAGVAPQLDALRRYLNAYRDDNQFYHHLVFSFGEDRRLAAKNPLKRELETVREIMDQIGIQGLVAYHPWRGSDESHEKDDRGEWKRRIGKNTDWDDIEDELEHQPHWHIIGVAPFIDFSDTPQIESETGAVLHRITQSDTNVSIENDKAMCRAVTYALSHAGIYNTARDRDADDNQRRLAAWMKGPDVHRISPLEHNKSRIQAITYKVAKTTLGIDPPNLTCDADLDGDQDVDDRRRDDGLPSLNLRDRHPLDDVWDTGDNDVGARTTGNGIRIQPPSGPSAPISTSTSGGSGRTNRSVDLPGRRNPFDSWSNGGSSTSSSSSSSSAPTNTGDRDDDADDQDDSADGDGETCGSRLRHISKANEYLLDREWNESHDEEDVRNIEVAYQSYVTWMESKGHEPHDDPLELPEEREDDPPPD